MKDIRKAPEDVLDIVQFEHWLRFYFVKEVDEGLELRVPEEEAERIEKELPKMFGLLELLNNRKIDQQICTETVCSFIAARLDGEKYPEGTVERVFDGKKFKLEMYLFNLWNRTHEAKLDQEYLFYTQWRQMFDQWKQTDEVKQYIAKLTISTPGTKTTQ
jgi:hypothetical protein